MNKEEALIFLKEQKESRLFGLDKGCPSDFSQWRKKQAETFQRLIDWIDNEVTE